MYKYHVNNMFHKCIGEFETQLNATKFAVRYMEDLLKTKENNSVGYRIIDEDYKNLLKFYNSIGTKFSPKPDKMYLGRYVSITVKYWDGK